MNHTTKDIEYCNTKTRLKKEFHHDSKDSAHFFLYKTVRSTIERSACFHNIDKMLVALSGGVDSSVLLHFMAHHRDFDNGPKIHVLHVNHAQRGVESDRDEDVSRKIAASYDCEFDVVRLAPTSTFNEDTLRTLRYEALQKCAAKNDISRIVLGHHMDDQVETFLYRLIRGSDIKGLSAMKVFKAPYVRPLLYVRRTELLREAENCCLPFVEDSSNFSTYPSRNYLRKVVLPAIESKLDPQVVEHIFDLSLSLNELDEIVTAQAAEMIKEVEVQPHQYSIKKLQKIASPLRKKMIQVMIGYIINDKGSVARDHIEMIDQWVERQQSPKYLQLPGNIRVEKSKGVLTFSIVLGPGE